MAASSGISAIVRVNDDAMVEVDSTPDGVEAVQITLIKVTGGVYRSLPTLYFSVDKAREIRDGLDSLLAQLDAEQPHLWTATTCTVPALVRI